MRICTSSHLPGRFLGSDLGVCVLSRSELGLVTCLYISSFLFPLSSIFNGRNFVKFINPVLKIYLFVRDNYFSVLLAQDIMALFAHPKGLFIGLSTHVYWDSWESCLFNHASEKTHKLSIFQSSSWFLFKEICLNLPYTNFHSPWQHFVKSAIFVTTVQPLLNNPTLGEMDSGRQEPW